MTRRWLRTWICLAVLCAAGPVVAQVEAPRPGGLEQLGNLKPPAGGFQGLGALGALGQSEATLTATFEADSAQPGKGRLHVVAEMADGWHMYSVTQEKTADGQGPNRTEITLKGAKLAGEFAPDEEPDVKHYDDVWKGLPIEEHHGSVRWTAPITFSADEPPESLSLAVNVVGQVCAGACKDVKQTLSAEFAEYYESARPTGVFTSPMLQAKVQAWAEPTVVAPGGQVKLHFRATPAEGWHVYALAPKDEEEGNETMLSLRRNGWKARVVASERPKKDDKGYKYHDKPVTWTVIVDVSRNAEEKAYTLAGQLGIQTCDVNGCLPPVGAKYEVEVEVSRQGAGGDAKAPMLFSASTWGNAAKSAARYTLYQPLTLSKLGITILICLGGGLLLNLMPCVLPVIGLKVMSFVEQAGQSRWQTIKLNLWYSAGMVGVFVILAVLAMVFQLSWGEQFTKLWFKVLMTGVVFAMALSFLGVWEIPIPGFAGSGKSQELQDKEGPSGAFFKGVFTTILATPCSGPFLGAMFAYTLSQPPLVIYVIFISIGVGMASPFLLAGFFPKLVNWLPQPGAWMETFKNLMGFLLLATVVYQFSTISSEYFIATLAMVMGIWFACWMLGQMRYSTNFDHKVRTWAGAAVVTGLAAWASFNYLGPREKILPWKPFTPAALAKAQEEGKTVLVEYTANWCPNCKLNMLWAIDTQNVKKVVDKNNVVALLADWTDESPVIKQSLNELNAASIPLLAVYPGSRPDDVIILKDLLSESDVIKALEDAGPSERARKDVARNVSAGAQ